MASCTGRATAGRTVCTMSVSMMPMMRNLHTTVVFTGSGSSLSGSSVVDPSAKEHFVSVSDPMNLIKKKETRGMELRTKPSDTADRSAISVLILS